MYEIFHYFKIFFESGIFIYTSLLFGSYFLLSLISALEMRKYMLKNSFVDYSEILSSPYVPPISVIAACHNEGKTIIDNIRSLLALHYNSYDVIIVNDASTDDTLEKIIKEFDLIKIDFYYNSVLITRPVNGIYRSRNDSFSKLIVIDKENGGKADSINAGLNISTHKYFLAIDVDCVLESDALVKMVKPFLEASDKKVIATGGTISIINSCKVVSGKVVEVTVPQNLISRAQVLEYTRSFLMGRMAWSRLNGLLIVSGAFGMFDREIVVKIGGYSSLTLGEDLELIVRMRRYMHDIKEKYRVVYIPDPLCWTEVPSKFKILSRQRTRWTRGTIATLLLHRKMFLNPIYGFVGMISFSFWVVFEWFAPFVEFFGILYFLLIIGLGNPNWVIFSLMFAFAYCFGVTFSVASILFEELSYHKYKKRGDIFKLVYMAFMEPITFHPMLVWFALKGNYLYLVGERRWGNMIRKGFGSTSNP
ncbi:MAG: glycosyltransferase [Bacteroidota bacterium]